MKNLKEKYEKIVQEYLEAFAKKQDVDLKYSYWVAGRVGENIDIGDHVFYFKDIKYDVDHNIRTGLIYEFEDESLEARDKDENARFPTYGNWLKLRGEVEA